MLLAVLSIRKKTILMNWRFKESLSFTQYRNLLLDHISMEKISACSRNKSSEIEQIWSPIIKFVTKCRWRLGSLTPWPLGWCWQVVACGLPGGLVAPLCAGGSMPPVMGTSGGGTSFVLSWASEKGLWACPGPSAWSSSDWWWGLGLLVGHVGLPRASLVVCGLHTRGLGWSLISGTLWLCAGAGGLGWAWRASAPVFPGGPPLPWG